LSDLSDQDRLIWSTETAVADRFEGGTSAVAVYRVGAGVTVGCGKSESPLPQLVAARMTSSTAQNFSELKVLLISFISITLMTYLRQAIR